MTKMENNSIAIESTRRDWHIQNFKQLFQNLKSDDSILDKNIDEQTKTFVDFEDLSKTSFGRLILSFEQDEVLIGSFENLLLSLITYTRQDLLDEDCFIELCAIRNGNFPFIFSDDLSSLEYKEEWYEVRYRDSMIRLEEFMLTYANHILKSFWDKNDKDNCNEVGEIECYLTKMILKKVEDLISNIQDFEDSLNDYNPTIFINPNEYKVLSANDVDSKKEYIKVPLLTEFKHKIRLEINGAAILAALNKEQDLFRDILKESFLIQFEKYLDWITNTKSGLNYIGTPSITDVFEQYLPVDLLKDEEIVKYLYRSRNELSELYGAKVFLLQEIVSPEQFNRILELKSKGFNF